MAVLTYDVRKDGIEDRRRHIPAGGICLGDANVYRAGQCCQH